MEEWPWGAPLEPAPIPVNVDGHDGLTRQEVELVSVGTPDRFPSPVSRDLPKAGLAWKRCNEYLVASRFGRRVRNQLPVRREVCLLLETGFRREDLRTTIARQQNRVKVRAPPEIARVVHRVTAVG